MDAAEHGRSILVQVTRAGMGEAGPELREKLLRTYLTLLSESGMLPGVIAFYAEGVKMVAQGSPVLDLLQGLESRGVRLIICKTCIDYYGMADQVAVGIVGGMPDIIAAQWAAEKVITI